LDQGADRRKGALPKDVTPLRAAVAARRPAVVQLLLARGASINERRGGVSALTIAATGGDLAMTRFLLSAGATPADSDLLWIPGPDRPEILALLQDALKHRTRAEADRASAEEAGIALPTERSAEPDGAREGDYALVVGIGKYQDAPPARFAEDDAAEVRKRLLALGWPSRNVLSLTGERAGRAGLVRYLESWLPSNAGRRGRIFFYFAGDGAVDPRTGTAYLLPYDGDPAMLEQTGYPLARLCEELAPLGAHGAAIVIDAGFPTAGVELSTGAARCALLLAAAPDRALEARDDLKHGPLTDALLRALSPDAPASATLRAFLDGVRADAVGVSRARGGAQEPLLLVGADAGSAPPP
jgi:hypothetical protein